MDAWWPDAPRPARIIAVTSAVALGYGTVVHLVHLAAAGLDPYPSVPDWLAAYFVSLTVLDPAAAALLLLRRRSGLILSCAVLLTDAAANGYANYVLDDADGITLGRIGQAVITVPPPSQPPADVGASDVPVLVAVGALNPFIDPEGLRRGLAPITRLQFLVHPTAGHNIVGSQPCAAEARTAWLDDLSIEVDDACTKAPLPDFFVSIE